MDILDDDLCSASPSTIFDEIAPDFGPSNMGILEESGFSDPFGNCPNNFDIVQFINDSNDTPVDSPLDTNLFNSELPQTQMQNYLPQQLNNNNNNNNNNVRMYTTTQNGTSITNNHLQQRHNGGAGNRRLPDSPPITDISAGGCSSASPSSGSDGSPFTPEQYRNYINPNNNYNNNINGQVGINNNNNINNNGVLLSMHIPNHSHPQQHQQNGNILPVGQTMLDDDDDVLRQIQFQQLIQQHQQQLSPQSEFLSPYPPSQSTPGSQHSSQVSPPALCNNNVNNNKNGIISQQPSQQQQQQQQQRYMMTPLSVASNDGNNYNNNNNNNNSSIVPPPPPQSQMGMYETRVAPNETMQVVQNQSGHKRRRTTNNTVVNSNCGGSSSGSCGSVNNENHCINNNLASIVKSELGINNNGGSMQTVPQRLFGMPNQQQNRINLASQLTPPLAPPSVSSFDDYDEGGLQRTIKFTPFCVEDWAPLYDCAHQELSPLNVQVVADKGFNYSAQDNCFVNQKKNHFQITVNISKLNTPGENTPIYVRLPQGELQPINQFKLAFCGVKNEMPTSEIQIRQSQTDRKPIAHEGVRFQLEQVIPTKQTVPRLHFSETTMNNHRKNGKPNSDQKFFLLVVKILALTPVGEITIQAYQSERVIVRASNPGQFEQPESDVAWQKANGNILTFNGQVAIGTDKPAEDAKLHVNGNIVATGNISRPSDRRVKEDIADMDTRTAMDRISQMRVVEFSYKPEIAKQWGLTEENRHRVGVIAQELAEVLPDAVRDNGEYLTVDDTRIFYDTVAAAQELYRLTGNLECKIDQVERISQKLARFAQKRKNHLGSMASGISDFSNLFGTASAANNGSDNKSFISYSHTSLTSCNNDDSVSQGGEGINKRLSNKTHRRCRSNSSASTYCQRRGGGGAANGQLCTSKITQGTIVTLVVIMALCLMAMCTLYVMDWYNRTYVYGPHHIIHRYPHPSNYPTYSTPIEEQPDPGKIYRIIEKKFLWKLPEESKAPPLAAICGQRNHCPLFCCAAAHSYDFFNEDGVEKIDSIKTLNNNSLLSQSLIDEVLALNQESTTINSELESGVRIEVLNLNTLLDSRYCTKEGICDMRKGRFDLYVPISPYLPTIPLLIKIHVEDGLFVDNCGGLSGFNHTVCEIDRETGFTNGYVSPPLSNRVTENVFELAIGGYLQTAFRFRVGHTTESCQMHDDQLGRSFDEYNLVFYRTCALNHSPKQQQEDLPTTIITPSKLAASNLLLKK